MPNFIFIRVMIVMAALVALSLCGGPLSRTKNLGQPDISRLEIFSGHVNATVEPTWDKYDPSASSEPGNDNSIFYTARPDFRRCVSPLCGGYFVKRVNQARTRCANGRWMPECYVAEIAWNNQPQVEPARALLRGSILAKTFGTFGNLGALQVTELWQAVSDKRPSGMFFRVRDRGLRCITFPCPTHHEAKLNSAVARNIAGVDLNGAGAGSEVMASATMAMTGPEGIIVAGNHVPVRGPGGRSLELKATQIYLHVRPQGSMLPCIKTGCSRQICADHDVVTTCEFRPEYACYEKARCERQPDGKCGFTRTPELTACLARK